MGRDSWMMLTSCHMWQSGSPVDFLNCLFLTHQKALCPGDLLTSSPASSAACQMVFTGQFIVPSMLLHKCHWLQAVPPLGSHQFIPPSFWCLCKIPKLRVWVRSVVSEKRRWVVEDALRIIFSRLLFFLWTHEEAWALQLVTWVLCLKVSERIWVSFHFTFPHLIPSEWQLSCLLFNLAVQLQPCNRAEGEPKSFWDDWSGEQGEINGVLRHEDLVSQWDACHNSDAWIWKGMPSSSYWCEDRQALWAGLLLSSLASWNLVFTVRLY